MSSQLRAASVHDLGDLSDGELDLLERQARGIARAAGGVSEVLEPLIDEVRQARHSRGSVPLELPVHLATDPIEVVLDQREAMVRAIELREDDELTPALREVWAVVVDRLALARREAKETIAERRRADPAEDLMVAELRAEEIARTNDGDPDDRLVRGGHEDAPGAGSGRDEPAPWQPEHPTIPSQDGVGPTPSSARTTDQLVSGPGMAGGTGDPINFPADTRVKPSTRPLSPEGDEEPPDIAHR